MRHLAHLVIALLAAVRWCGCTPISESLRWRSNMRRRPRGYGRNTLILLVDDSRSVGPYRFNDMRKMLTHLVNEEAEDMAENGMEIGIVKFGTWTETVLAPTMNAARVKSAVRNMKYGDQSQTDIVGGLNRASALLRGKYGDHGVVLLTDGGQTAKSSQSPSAAASALKSHNACVALRNFGRSADRRRRLRGIAGCVPAPACLDYMGSTLCKEEKELGRCDAYYNARAERTWQQCRRTCNKCDAYYVESVWDEHGCFASGMEAHSSYKEVMRNVRRFVEQLQSAFIRPAC